MKGYWKTSRCILCFSFRHRLPFLLTFCSSSHLLSSVRFSCSVVSDSLQPRGLQHARPPCPSPMPGAYSNSSPLNRWCHPIHYFLSYEYERFYRIDFVSWGTSYSEVFSHFSFMCMISIFFVVKFLQKFHSSFFFFFSVSYFWHWGETILPETAVCCPKQVILWGSHLSLLFLPLQDPHARFRVRRRSAWCPGCTPEVFDRLYRAESSRLGVYPVF